MQKSTTHLDGCQTLLAVPLLDADVNVILAGVVSLRSIRERVCRKNSGCVNAGVQACAQRMVEHKVTTQRRGG